MEVVENKSGQVVASVKKRIFSKLGYAQQEADQIVKALNLLLANYSVHYQKLRNFHWNVKGPDFFDIHEQFEKQYNTAKLNIDDIAERIRVFGKTPLSKMQDYIDFSEIVERGTNLNSDDMVADILNDYSILLEYMVECIEQAIEFGDSGTEDMIKSFVKQIEEYHWMMSAFSAKS